MPLGLHVAPVPYPIGFDPVSEYAKGAARDRRVEDASAAAARIAVRTSVGGAAPDRQVNVSASSWPHQLLPRTGSGPWAMTRPGMISAAPIPAAARATTRRR